MHSLPLPLGDSAWPSELREDAHNLWKFHLALLQIGKTKKINQPTVLIEEATRAAEGRPLTIMEHSVSTNAYTACRSHNLPFACLAQQVRAAARFLHPLWFKTAANMDVFVRNWAGSHAQLLAALAGQKGKWQQKTIHELARAFFLTGHLCCLQRDLAQNRLFIPLDELQQANVTVAHLQRGIINEAMRRLLWKQTVRIRDAYARGHSLDKDLSGWQRRAFRLYWLGGLYLLAEIENRGYDVWSRPFTFPLFRRLQLRVQVLTGKTSFR